MSSLLKNLLFALGLAVLLWAGYWFFVRDTGESPEPTRPMMSVEAIQQSERFVALLNELNGMNIDTNTLQDPRFMSLQNFRIDIGVEPVGRDNPFAPVD